MIKIQYNGRFVLGTTRNNIKHKNYFKYLKKIHKNKSTYQKLISKYIKILILIFDIQNISKKLDQNTSIPNRQKKKLLIPSLERKT